jgi:pimeloyl-ACP methyl ester carboxylesterase
MRRSRLWLTAALLLPVAPLAAAATPAQPALTQPGLHGEVSFSDYPPIATAGQVASRLLSPIAAEGARRLLQASGKQLDPQMIDIRREKYLLYVPRQEPSAGYGLFVFVPPWPQAQMPDGWSTVFDKYGMIFVSAYGSGNDASVFDRRIPLALAALGEVKANFRIDPASTLVGGFSGGSRVALRIALAYPDEFRGVLLNSGSDPIAESSTQLPSPDLFQIFQTRTQVAFVTGDDDQGGLALDAASLASMRHWCVSNVSFRNEHGVGHEAASVQTLDWALHTLLARPKPDSSEMAACRAARRRDVDSALAGAQRAIDKDPRGDGRRLLLDIDGKYGGLAAPQSIRLGDQCSCGIFGSR